MYIHSVKLLNYKSFGKTKESELIFEPTVTAIVGKNESGKSNLLEGLSHINFFRNMVEAFNLNYKNVMSNEIDEIEYIITMKPTKKDKQKGLYSDSFIRIKRNLYEATGGIASYFYDQTHADIDIILSAYDSQNPSWLSSQQERENYFKFRKELTFKEKINLPIWNDLLKFFLSHIRHVSSEKHDDLRTSIGHMQTKLLYICNILPKFYYRKSDKILKTKYALSEISAELNTPTSYPNSLLTDFVRLIEITLLEITEAARAGDSNSQLTLRKKINKAVETKINKPFNEFYKTEKINLSLSYNQGITFAIQSNDGGTIVLSERSNGLKWYLNTFIDMEANGFRGENLVFLLDEPGVSLHVSAQKELLKKFMHLSRKGNQIIYTTHSPSMLDVSNNGIQRIRTIEKDSQGFSHINNKAYHSKNKSKQNETLAPIIKAIGMTLDDTFGPSLNKVNIVTEGIIDQIYITSMAKVLGIDLNNYAFIASKGASNIENICSILQGWGCRFVAIFDYDKEGVNSGEGMRKEMDYIFNKDYFYLGNATQEDITDRTYIKNSCCIEDYISEKELNKIFPEIKNPKANVNKTIRAKELTDAVVSKTIQLESETVDNFRKLFNKIESIFSEETENQILLD